MYAGCRSSHHKQTPARHTVCTRSWRGRRQSVAIVEYVGTPTMRQLRRCTLSVNTEPLCLPAELLFVGRCVLEVGCQAYQHVQTCSNTAQHSIATRQYGSTAQHSTAQHSRRRLRYTLRVVGSTPHELHGRQRLWLEASLSSRGRGVRERRTARPSLY